MIREIRTLGIGLVSCALLLAACARVEEKPQEQAEKPQAEKPQAEKEQAEKAQAGAMEEMMAEYMKYATPGPEHEHFKKVVGRWKATSKFWMEPGAPPQTGTGTAEFRLLLGGRYLMQEFRSEFMEQPFEGIGIEGYDNFRKQYISTWIDNMGTTIMTMAGNCDAEGKQCTYYGRVDDPVTGQVGKLVKSTARWVDENTTVFEMYDSYGGPDWVRVMEITYRRAE